MPVATVTSKGQITIPVDLRRRFNIKTGTRIDFFVNEAGHIELWPKTVNLADLAGYLAPYYSGPPISIEEMNEAVMRAVADHVNSSKETEK
jgi:AbrB family looped-hinge helix DNA binding protein